jgi:hypothetical protein
MVVAAHACAPRRRCAPRLRRYKATVKASINWRDILRPNLATSRKPRAGEAGGPGPGFSVWLDSAFTDEQRREVRQLAAQTIQVGEGP